MQKGTTFVGLDVHKEVIDVAMLLPGEARPVEWQTSNDQAAVRRLVRKLQPLGGPGSAAVPQGGSVRLLGAAHDSSPEPVVRRGGPVARPAQARRTGQDGPP